MKAARSMLCLLLKKKYANFDFYETPTRKYRASRLTIRTRFREEMLLLRIDFSELLQPPQLLIVGLRVQPYPGAGQRL